ncbi:MAG TPA: P1 family peptidase [Actinomycetota bacterium]|nr:P1 family peptidase [Actinomycetota bacterium]
MTSLGFGVRVGHWTDADARTGCTVVLPPPGNVASCEVRGSSPGSRETELLHPDRRLTEVHAILLTGGSAFGLAAADGVAAWLEERGVGYRTSAAVVPIVPAAVVYDLATGRADVRPGPAEGRAACDAAADDGVETGLVGAGTGTTAGKWAGREHAVDGGLGIGRAGDGPDAVSALAVVNPVGDVVAADGTVLAGARAPAATGVAGGEPPAPFNTVLAVVATAAALGKRDARWLAARGADGVTVSVRPAHTRYDGDVCFALAVPPPDGAAPHDLDVLGRHATEAVAAAVRAAVTR